jgi:SAM-dependent methyltransferase
MHFGSEEAFHYLECAACGCVQIIDPPSDVERAYAVDYGPFKKVKYRGNNVFKAALAKKSDRYTLFKEGIIGRLINATFGKESLFDLMGRAHIKTNARVLDVGCGAGNLLDYLQELGFTDLTGIEPYAPTQAGYGTRIMRKTIENLTENNKFDVIVFNHSFEHLTDQLGTLRKVSSLLSESGLCLIRMPVKTEYIWNLYGTNWVQLDAPRHTTIHTVKSFEFLLGRTDLALKRIIFDSLMFQFVGSEQYLKGIPLNSEVDPKKRLFNARQLRAFKKLAKQLNAAGQGDQATFCVQKSAKIA